MRPEMLPRLVEVLYRLLKVREDRMRLKPIIPSGYDC